MADIQHGVGGQRHRRRWREKTPIRSPEHLHHRFDRFHLHPGHRRHFTQPRRSPRITTLGAALAQALKQPFCNRLLRRVQFLQRLVSMLRQGAGQAADRFVIRQGQPVAFSPAGPQPHPHQRMLQHRQLIRVRADIVE